MRSFLAIQLGLLLLAFSCASDDNNGTPIEPHDQPNPGEYYVDIYDEGQTWGSTTLLTDSHDENTMKVVEVDMEGEIIWEFDVPQAWLHPPIVGFDAELLGNGNILIVISRTGLFEIDRDGSVVWEHDDPKCSHDADRLPNGNTIYVFGNGDTKEDACIKEVDSQGALVWSWFAKDHYDIPPYNSVDYQGWTHTNAVTRMDNGSTLISIRNFDMTVIVDADGQPVWEIRWQDLYPATTFPILHPHEPEIHADGTLITCLQNESPYEVVTIDRSTRDVLWEYNRDNFRTCRDADRLPNGNVLVVGVRTDLNESVVFEVTPSKEIVWQLRLYQTPVATLPGHFYKAQRLE